MFTHAEALIQSADRETWQTTSIMASELIGKGVEEGEEGEEGKFYNESMFSFIFHQPLFAIRHPICLTGLRFRVNIKQCRFIYLFFLKKRRNPLVLEKQPARRQSQDENTCR